MGQVENMEHAVDMRPFPSVFCTVLSISSSEFFGCSFLFSWWRRASFCLD